MDSDLTQAAEVTDQTELGSDLYFQLSMTYPIPELVYSIVGKYWFLCARSIYSQKSQLRDSPIFIF